LDHAFTKLRRFILELKEIYSGVKGVKELRELRQQP
jgi:hypothetical protein